MKRVERGRGEIDKTKSMLRKYASKNKDEKAFSKRAEIIKFLTRRESKLKMASEDTKCATDVIPSKKVSSESNPDIIASKLGIDCKDDEANSEIARSDSEDFLLETSNCDFAAVVEKVIEAEIKQNEIECSPNDDVEEKVSVQEKKSSRFRIRESFHKFDLKVRRAFSLENSTSIDTVICQSCDENGKSCLCEHNDQTLDNLIEKEIEEAEEALESIDPELTEESLPSAADSLPESPLDLSSCNISKVSLDLSASGEIKDDSEPVCDSAGKGSGKRESLTLFDENGQPIPPPRKRKSASPSNSTQTIKSADNEESSELISPSTSRKSSNDTSLDKKKHNSETSNSVVGGECPTDKESLPITTPSSSVTSPASNLGVFKFFMQNIAKKSSSNTLTGMLAKCLTGKCCKWSSLTHSTHLFTNTG